MGIGGPVEGSDPELDHRRHPRGGPPLGATYRVQFGPGFGFDDAAGLAPYLAELGVTHLYASPYLQAVPGSTHGYDVVDHGRPSDDLGGADAHRRLCESLAAAGLGQILDIVPNHMAIGHPANRWWWDVLEHGLSSPYAGHFDVDWAHADRILLPVLGGHYGDVLAEGGLQVVRIEGRFEVQAGEQRFPLAARSYRLLLADATQGLDEPQLRFLERAFAVLTEDRDGAEDTRVLVELLGHLARDRPAVAAALDAAVALHNDDRDRLHRLLECQHYRLAHWRTATESLGHRRFFDVTSLAGLRTEDPRVFADMHRRVLSWIGQGLLDGLRIDHPDGLRDPTGYLEQLAAAAPGAWIVVEKILMPGERLPSSWPVAGTTGYDFVDVVNALWVDPAAEPAFTALYGEVSGEPVVFRDVVATSRRLVVERVVAAEVSQLVERLAELCATMVRHRDHLHADLRRAIEALLTVFPVYRTYIRPDPHGGVPDVAEADTAVIGRALRLAAEEAPDIDLRLWELVEDVLLLRVGGPTAVQPPQVVEFSARFQQTTGPAMAKGVEDTAFYRYNRFVALNEVGGEPDRFGTTVAAFHEHNQVMARRWPHTMLTTSTHDTKRSEDVRARLAVLSEVPQAWAAAVARWTAHNERHRTDGNWPDRNLEYALYQAFVGAHPLPVERALTFVTKAMREAKQHTSWLAPNDAYEAAVERFVRAALADEVFLADLAGFVEPLVWPGRVNSLAQQLLKLTSVGVPDVYVGSELWTDGLVDPDNRRPVDLDRRRSLLAELDAGLCLEDILARSEEGLPKLWVTATALRVRLARPDAFLGGAYHPLAVDGPGADQVIAFTRGEDVAVVVPRLVAASGGRPRGAATVPLPPGPWHNVFDGQAWTGPVDAADVLARFPVALLTRAAG